MAGSGAAAGVLLGGLLTSYLSWSWIFFINVPVGLAAIALTPAQVQQLTTKLERISGKKVQLTQRQDPALLGGVVAKVGDVVYDGSVRSQLRKLRDSMSK